MAANIPARAATSPDLEKFRDTKQAVKLGLAIRHPETVYTARINQVFTGVPIAQFSHDGGAGTLADILIGMTLLVGSTAGANDKGEYRIRQLPTSTIFYIGQIQKVLLEDNDFVTVINDLSRIWPRDITNDGGDILMDFNIEFGNLENGGIIPRIGPLVSVIYLAEGEAIFAPLDPSLSAGYDGATITDYLYDFPGASATSGLDTTSPTATYDTPGEYIWSCSITDSLGRVTTTYRTLFVDPPEVEFNLESCVGDFDDGDWSFEVTGYTAMGQDEIRDRTLVTLYEIGAYYGSSVGSIGKLAGYENIKCSGWVDGESITYDNESGEVSFMVYGANYWLSKIRALPFDIQDTSAAPVNWKQIQEMTIDKALARMLYWTSTAPVVMDCFFSGDTTRLKVLAQPSGSLREQLESMAFNTIFAKPAVNNYGQLFIQVDPQIIDSAARSALPVVMDITKEDRFAELDIDLLKTDRTAMLELSATSDYDGVTSIPIYSRAWGAEYGDFNSYEDYIIPDQDECNRISGCLLAIENNPFEPIEIKLSANNGLFDIAPAMYATLSIDAGDTPRGIVLDEVRLIPRRVTLEYDKDASVLLTVVMFEFEAIGADGVEYHPPTVLDNNLDYGMDDFGGGLDFPGLDDFFSPTVPADVEIPCDSNMGNSYSLTWSPRVLTGNIPTQLIAKADFPCMIRAAGGLKVTTIDINCGFSGDARDHVNMYGVKDDARVITGSWVGNVVTFSPVGDLEVDGFEIELDAGVGVTILKYAPGKIIEIGVSGVSCTMNTDPNQYYSIEGYQGHWYANQPPWGVIAPFYNFSPYGGYVGGLEFGIGYTPALPGMSLQNDGALFFAAEAVSRFYGRIYFKGNGVVTFTPNDVFAPFSIVSNFRWMLREAQAIGRQLRIGSSMLNNVCAVSV